MARTATARIAGNPDAVATCAEDSDEAEVADWFAGANPKLTLQEEAIGLGSYGRVLTLLTLDEVDEDEEETEWEEPRF